MTSLVLTVRETLRYRGAIGQWSWVLHRLTGLGVVLFLALHVIDTSWAVFFPELYVKAIASYQSPLFTIGEFGLIFAVVYHALNGLRIAIFDNKPELWEHQERAAYAVLGITVILLVPVFLLMFGHVAEFYNGENPVLPIIDSIVDQLPFIVGFAAAAVVAVLLSGLYGVVVGESEDKTSSGSRSERFWWSFMRISGVLIIPLVFGHLAMMHVIQGVFDLTAIDHTVVGTLDENTTGTAVEFVADRWNYAAGGVFIWRVYDFALLVLVTLHGFNGLRYVLTDYTMSNPFIRRAATYFTAIGAAVLLVVGGAALFNTIDDEMIHQAQEATVRLYGEICESYGEGEEQPENCANFIVHDGEGDAESGEEGDGDENTSDTNDE